MLAVGSIVLGLVAGAALLGPEAAPAHACTFRPFHEQFMADSVNRAEVVAVGTLEGPQGDAIAMVVEEGLKGAAAGDRLTINNASNLDCWEEIQTGRQNYKAGARVLVFLVPDTFGVAQYQVERFGWDIFRVEGDSLHPYVGTRSRPLPRIEDVRAAFRTAAEIPYDPARKSDPECRDAFGAKPTEAEQWAAGAEAIVIATVVGDRDGATVLRVDESFRGGLSGEITLNDSYFLIEKSCDRIMNGRGSWPAGKRVAAMLVRDEFGVAEWRPAIWGRAVWEINASDLVRYDGIPLLSEVREATIRAGFQPSVPTAVASQPSPGPPGEASPGDVATAVASRPDGAQPDNGLPWVPIALVAVLAAAVLALVTWLRIRR